MLRLLTVLISFAFVASASAASKKSQAIGSYAQGKLKNAVTLSREGKGYLKLFIQRNRGWSTQSLNNALLKLGQYTSTQLAGSERLQIGDCSARTGGKITRHSSHQNGLDADLAYFRHDHREQDPEYNDGFDEEFVKDGALSPNFDLERNWKILHYANQVASVGRIFVDPLIKRTFCKYAQARGALEKEREFLRKLRPLEGHADHFHLRLKCPPGNRQCEEQDAPDPGDGCAEV